MKHTLKTAAVYLWLCVYLRLIEARLGGSPEVLEAKSSGIKFHPSEIVQNFETECNKEEFTRYRTPDGTCNNAFNRGSANTPLVRILPPQYDDGEGAPRTRGKNGKELPSPTDVSRALHADGNAFGDSTLMFMQFGQFMDHDLGLAPIPASELGALHCCSKHGSVVNASAERDCLPIKVDDSRFFGKCMEFSRSIPAYKDQSGSVTVPREQFNEITSFADGSMIYGSSKEVLELLRDSDDRALLKLGENQLLPRAEKGECLHRPEDYCFLAGDTRVNEQPGLAVIHTFWVRLHNRIAENIRNVRPHDDPENIFQLSRKIVVAILQNILYNEWLPMALGDKVMHAYGLSTGKRVAFLSNADPSIINAFTTAAFRFGHSLIPRQYNVSGVIFPLRKLFHKPDLVFDDFYGMLRALVSPTADEMKSQRIDRLIVDEVTGHLFEPKDQEKDAPSRGLDLVALNIQRGRDHGLPPFNTYRKLCGLPPIKSFEEFGGILQYKLQSVYDSVDDIDLFSGGLLEPTDTPEFVSPTFACILATQFSTLKFGDRFYFETDRPIEGFTDEQLDELREVTMSKVLCFFPSDKEFRKRRSDVIRRIQKNAFLVPSDTNTVRPCVRLRRNFLNFDLWAKP